VRRDDACNHVCNFGRKLRRCAQARRPAGGLGDSGRAHQTHYFRLRRICRPLRRGQSGGNARARVRLPRWRAFQGRPAGQAGRSVVLDRQAAVPERGCAGARHADAGAINLSFTEADFTRGQQLVKEKTITEQTFEQRSQAYRNAQASVSGAEAAVRSAELDLEFTELRAPISGRIGDRRVAPGNLVTGGVSGNTTLLATIVTSDPIQFEFTFDEASYLRYERIAKTGKDVASRGAGVNVSLKLIDENDFVHAGQMDFVDNVIDRSTGTIRGRAAFANPDGVFTPGMFARVRVPASPPYEALLVPDAAIGSEQVRKFVLVVGADNKAQMKYVTLGQLVDNLRVIKEGLAPADRIIVNGMARVRPGQPVNAQAPGAAPSGGAAAPAAPAK